MNSTNRFAVHLTTSPEIMSNEILKMIPIKKRRREIREAFACHPIACPNNQTNGNKVYKNKQMNDKNSID